MSERSRLLLAKVLLYPQPLRVVLARRLLGWGGLRFPVRLPLKLPFSARVELGLVERIDYSRCLWQGAIRARQMGLERISALEFGVAGGNGLVALEEIAEEITKELDVSIDIYGFDSGLGLPSPKDHRDMPYQWAEGFFRMDRTRLESRLTCARLVLGDVAETASTFIGTVQPAPIGAVLFDLDYHSSTAAALAIFDGPSEAFLPRIPCYFDDIYVSSQYMGVLLAIEEFNVAHPERKLVSAYGAAAPVTTGFGSLVARPSRVFEYHDFGHPRYAERLVNDDQLPLADRATHAGPPFQRRRRRRRA